MKRFLSVCCAFFVVFSGVFARAEGVEVNAKSVLLMEQSTKEVLYENNPDEQLPIASVTKIMTMLLIMEAIDDGRITMEDMVPVSERAMSMGGSTMFLEVGEQLSVYEMLKGIAVASANDGCVAMAEYISGSEAGFVEEMNKKAQELGMLNTHFVNTNGLDDENHYSSARDVALMSAELLKHDKIFEFTTIWTDRMHNGDYELANTNKLIRFYNGANGLKTGSTSKALCCISATAVRDDLKLIAVVLGAPTSQERFNSARALLDYGFANYKIQKGVSKGDEVARIEVKKGITPEIPVVCENDFSLLTKKSDELLFENEIFLENSVNAPVNSGQHMGKMIFMQNGQQVGEVNLIAGCDAYKKSFIDFLWDLIYKMLA